MNVQKITDQYLATAIWAEDQGDLGGATIYDVSPESRELAEREVRAFIAEAEDLLTEWPDDQIGHDLWLTSRGHGSGFWDRTEWPNGKELAELCADLSCVSVFLGDDGKIEIER